MQRPCHSMNSKVAPFVSFVQKSTARNSELRRDFKGFSNLSVFSGDLGNREDEWHNSRGSSRQTAARSAASGTIAPDGRPWQKEEDHRLIMRGPVTPSCSPLPPEAQSNFTSKETEVALIGTPAPHVLAFIRRKLEKRKWAEWNLAGKQEQIRCVLRYIGCLNHH